MNYLPEGCIYDTEANQRLIADEDGLRTAFQNRTDIEVKAIS